MDLKRHLEELQQLAAMKPPKFEEDKMSVSKSKSSRMSGRPTPKPEPMGQKYSQ